MRPTRSLFACLAALALGPLASRADAPVHLPGLHDAATLVRDTAGIVHVTAADEHDLFFLQGWVHAEDRLFQMDVTRRTASGTLAELLGSGALGRDVQLRTFGLRRAAARGEPLLSRSTHEALEAYAAGVNAWVKAHAGALPPEYAPLGVTTFAEWTVLDSLASAKLIAFGLSFDLDDIDRTIALVGYEQAGQALGFDGARLFSEDLFRSAPFDPASTVPDAQGPAPAVKTRTAVRAGAARLEPRTLELAREWMKRIHADPFLSRLAGRDDRDGSNQWVVAGAYTASGATMLASDPHLALGAPSTFYPIHLRAGTYDAIGNSFAGVPSVVVGHNRHVAWGATVDPFDVTDVYQEQLVPDGTSPSGLSTVYRGELEHVIAIPEQFYFNQGGTLVQENPPAVPPATLVVPRRNGGPIVQFDPKTGVALSVQYTGFSGTREVETFLGFDRARNLDDFVQALQTFDAGSQNFCYADDAGNIAYFTNSEIPVREDLQAGTVNGLPPWFIRDGQGGNEWLPVQHPQPDQAVPYEILPFSELPQIVNPPAGFAVNANNDPAGLTLANRVLANQRPGGGIYYLAPGFDTGFRAGRITRRIQEVLAHGKMTFEQMQSIQADVQLLDGEVLAPFVVQAFANARREGAPPALAALAARPDVAEAVGRLAAWDGKSPTGIPEGWDAADANGVLGPPTQAEIADSVAATIYAVWRGQVIASVIDAKLTPYGLEVPPGQQAVSALRNLLDHFDTAQGVGASGMDFFPVPGMASAADRRDTYLLSSLAGALDLLNGPAFDDAFPPPRTQADLRWGRLHRIVFSHPMGGPFSIPPAFGLFPAPLAGLPGIPTDGGFGAVDASNHDARAASSNAFMYTSGPSNRLVVELSRGAVKRAESVWPGGASALPQLTRPDGTTAPNPYYLNLLPRWLTNDTVPLVTREPELRAVTAAETRFVP
jgi:penicillin amidase